MFLIKAAVYPFGIPDGLHSKGRLLERVLKFQPILIFQDKAKAYPSGVCEEAPI
jgi:hypothetical protein